MKLWEVLRKPAFTVTPDMLLRRVKALFRRTGERVAPVVDGDGRVHGYVTWVEAILPTSRKSAATVKDAMREHPILYEDVELEEAYRRMLGHGVWAAPVVKSPEEPVLRGVVTFRDMLKVLIDAGYAPVAESVGEVMTTERLDDMIIEPGERVTRVWARIVKMGLPGVVVVRGAEEKVPIGLVTAKNFVDTDRWLFRRESETGLAAPAKVRRIMTRGVLAATVDTPVEYVAKAMVENDLTMLPVVDKDGKVVGVVTQADVLRAYIEGRKPGRAPVPLRGVPVPVAAEEKIRYATRETVLVQRLVAKPAVAETIGPTAGEVAVAELPAVRVLDTVEHARKEMLRRKTNYLLVVDEEGKVIGVVSKWSMLKAIGLKGPLWRRRLNDRLFIEYVMETDLPQVRASEPLENAALALVSKGAEVAVVVDDEGRTVGYITKDQLVKAYVETQRGRALVENVMTPGRMGVVHPHHTLYHAVNKMRTFYLDALAVYDGSRVRGVVSANRLPFVAYEDSARGPRSRRLIWVRKLVRGAARFGRYVKVSPLLALDAMVPLRVHVSPRDDVVKAVELMEKYRVDGVPVVGEDGLLLGIVCKNDIVRELARTAKRRAEVAERLARPRVRGGE